tara:strand:- start:6859 stop:7785 length:927 start_codon:yes stop_codon:yes gene_type:complete
VVTPVYGCAEALPELCQRLHIVLGSITPDYEIIMVNDACPDGSWAIIQSLATEDSRVKGINFSRNFGQHYAITAGLDFARSDWVVVMDCDLQDIPEEIPKLHEVAQTGFDIVVGKRAERKDSLIRKWFSKNFYRLFSYFTGSKVDHRIASFGIYSKKAILSIRQLREQNRSFGLFALWVGFHRAEINVNHATRVHGRSSYTLRKMLRLAFDSIVAHSDRLLRLTVMLGFTLSMLSFSYALWIIIQYFLRSTPISGWTSLIVSIYFSTGVIIGAVGVVGLYVGKIFDEVKRRPLYLISDTTFELQDDEY